MDWGVLWVVLVVAGGLGLVVLAGGALLWWAVATLWRMLNR